MADQPIQSKHVDEPKGKGRTSDGAAKKEEARHKVPQQCLRGPSIVAKKAGNTNTGPRDPDREAMEVGVKPSTQVHSLEEHNHMVELETPAAGPSTSQATGGTLLARVNPPKDHAREGGPAGASTCLLTCVPRC